MIYSKLLNLDGPPPIIIYLHEKYFSSLKCEVLEEQTLIENGGLLPLLHTGLTTEVSPASAWK